MRHESCELGRSVKVRDIIKIIQSDGWTEVRTNGSHRHFAHQSKSGVVTIAGRGSQDVPIATLRQIYRQAGLDWSRRPR